MKKLVSCLVIVLSFSLTSLAQNEDKVVRRAGGGGFTIGYGNLDVSKLQVFVSKDIPKFKNDQLLIGGTGHAFINKFVIGGSGFALMGDAIKTDSLKIKVGGGLGTFDFGYLVVDQEHLKIYPLIGIGGSGYGINIARNKDMSVGNIVKNPGQEININKGGMVIDASLNLNIIPVIQFDEKDNSYGGFMTGLKAGYMYSFSSSDWNYAGGDVTGGPNFGIRMFYVKLIVGGFGWNKSK